MKKIMWSGIVLLIAIVLFIVDVVMSFNSPVLWWAVLGEAIVSIGVFLWHMGIISNYKLSN